MSARSSMIIVTKVSGSWNPRAMVRIRPTRVALPNLQPRALAITYASLAKVPSGRGDAQRALARRAKRDSDTLTAAANPGSTCPPPR
jgi:hypothetical protein